MYSRRELLKASTGVLMARLSAFEAAPLPVLKHTKGEKISFSAAGRLLFESRYTPARPKTYVHPFCAPDGSPLTLDGPADHIHHRGVTIGWSNVNGYEFFGEDNPGLPKGRIVHQRFEKMAETPYPTVTAINHWVGGDEVFVIERRTIAAPAQVGGMVWMLWDSELRAAKAGTVLRTDKAVYNGLGIRLIHEMDGGRVLNSDGRDSVASANGQRAAWAAYSGALPSGGTAGIALFDHPSNPRHPTPFFVMNRFGYISAAPTFYEPLPLEESKPLQFRFAVVGFLGEARRENLDRWFRSWASSR
jgi:hypothetical protein